MGKGVYYNEFNRQKAAWLRHLIEEGVIAHGVVDERSIAEVQPEDLDGFIQHHFFAGIGLWSLCLRRAGWPDDRPVWTGSCPCGPFSRAGKQLGFADPRHLWPEWFRLIRQRRPDVLFGEQSPDAVEWIDLVSANLEGIGYAIGAPDIPAAGFAAGAHLRQRFGFVADTNNSEWWSDRAPWNDGDWPTTGRVEGNRYLGDGGPDHRLANAAVQRWGQEQSVAGERLGRSRAQGLPTGLDHGGDGGGLANANDDRRQRCGADDGAASQWSASRSHIRAPGLLGGARVDWLLGRDGRWRPIECGLSPVVDAHPERLGLLRGYGDAIDVEAFTQLIAAYLEVAPPQRAAA